MFFSFNQSIFADHIQGYVWGWHEYGAFIGPVVAALALIALTARLRENWPLLVLIVVSLVLVLGSFAPPYSPWDLLHHLPGFKSLRVPSRFSLLTLIAVALLAGRGLDFLLSQTYRPKIPAIAAVGLVLSINLAVCLPILGESFTRPAEKATPAVDFRQIEGDPNRMYAAFLANRGTIRAGWLSAYRPGRGILGYDGQTLEWYSENDAIRVTRREFSPNRIVFDVAAPRGGDLTISQGFDPGWRSFDGRPISAQSDLVSVPVYPTDRRIEVFYFPRYLVLGAVMSVISIAAALLAAIFNCRSRKKA